MLSKEKLEVKYLPGVPYEASYLVQASMDTRWVGSMP